MYLIVHSHVTETVDILFLVDASSLVFFMQAGFAMLCEGSVRKETIQNTILKIFLIHVIVSWLISVWDIHFVSEIIR